jgi:pimeloyl-ACP methyl ester carboxylesterase
VKSADWTGNRPFALKAWSAVELARLPTYYVMDADADMAVTVAPNMPEAAEIAECKWLTETELAVYTREFCRTGFQGGLNWYRGRTDGGNAGELLFAGRTIDVPAVFIAGRSDWGMHQRPGDLEAMRTRGCSRLTGIQLVDGAGHWVQQEQPDAVVRLLLDFLKT